VSILPNKVLSNTAPCYVCVLMITLKHQYVKLHWQAGQIQTRRNHLNVLFHLPPNIFLSDRFTSTSRFPHLAQRTILFCLTRANSSPFPITVLLMYRFVVFLEDVLCCPTLWHKPKSKERFLLCHSGFRQAEP
jgi:hypothetical protein